MTKSENKNNQPHGDRLLARAEFQVPLKKRASGEDEETMSLSEFLDLHKKFKEASKKARVRVK